MLICSESVMARVNKTQFAVLGVLSIRSMSAYEIKQFIQRSVGFFWAESEAQLYPTLKKLSQQGWVIFHEEKATKAGNKKIYTITEHGRKALISWLESKTERPIYRNELLLKLFFGNNQSEKGNIEILKQAMLNANETLKLLEAIKNNLAKTKVSCHRMLYVELTIEYGMMSLKTEISWCEMGIRRIESLQIEN